MKDFSRSQASELGSKLGRKAGVFLWTLTPGKGSFSGTAKQIGYTVIIYVLAMAATVWGLALAGIFYVILPIVLIPLIAFIAHRIAKAARAAEETNGKE